MGSHVVWAQQLLTLRRGFLDRQKQNTDGQPHAALICEGIDFSHEDFLDSVITVAGI